MLNRITLAYLRLLPFPIGFLMIWTFAFPQTHTTNYGNAGKETKGGSVSAPKFEVATIKPADPSGRGAIGLYTYPGGRVFAGESTLKMLIRDALNIQPFQIVGGPPWVGTEKYDVVGLPPDSSPSRRSNTSAINTPPNEEQRQMLLALLTDRFGLRLHRETKETRVYVLVRSKDKLRLETPHSKTDVPWMAILMPNNGLGAGEMVGRNVSMSFLAARLGAYLGYPVSDATGISGSFDLHVDAPGGPTYNQTEGIFYSVQQLGLKLQAGKGTVDTFVIDSATKPTPN